MAVCVLGSILLVLAGCWACQAADVAAGLSKGFQNPPDSARPWVYWFWLNGNITREGITADLESMRRVGIGGVLIMEVEQGTPPGPARFAGPQWRELFKFVLTEAHRLGLEVNMNNDAGWCGSGGPWITPELAQKKIVWTETRVQGPGKFAGTLPQPEAVANFYRNSAVLAFPSPAGEDPSMAACSPKLTVSGVVPGLTAHKPQGGKPADHLVLPPPEKGKPQYVQIEFPRPFTARSLTLPLKMVGVWPVCSGMLQVSDDGAKFRTVCEFAAAPPLMVLRFDTVSARWFRIVFTTTDTWSYYPLQGIELGNVDLSGRFVIENIRAKAAFTPEEVPPSSRQPAVPEGSAIPHDHILDLTSQLGKDGRLAWEAPAGKWTVLRIGYTPTGKDNHPAPMAGRGLECDKLSKAGADAMFAGLMGKLIADSQSLVPKTLVSTHIDSWEVGSQNWTAHFREEFRKRRGYDPLPFLPVVTGRVVDSLEISDRFLWDLRQTVSDLLVENYAGRFRELAHRHGMRLSIEAYDQCPCSQLAYAGQADEPMAEFWSWARFGEAFSCTEMSSAAHVYGKRILGAEAFTAGDTEKWLGHPAIIKDLGDWAFCEGINRFVVHRYAMQPWPDRKPGMSMGPWGLHYERTQTWWEQSAAWHTYLTRCQFLLRQGLFVADICCLAPEGSPMRFIPPTSVRPAGVDRGTYNFDGCPPEVLLTRMKVKDGRLVLPDGMSYRLLVLPPVETMTPRLLRKIKELVAAGATVVGPAPVKSPSLVDYPRADEEVKRLAGELWGQGRIVTDKTPAQVLEHAGVRPDFSGAPLRYIHRRSEDTDIYFVANPVGQRLSVSPTFRVSGRTPELWWPESGRTEPAALFRSRDGLTQVSFVLEPHGSVFVVFRNTLNVNAAVDLSLNGLSLAFSDKPTSKITIDRAVYGVLNDPKRTRDLRRQIQNLVDHGTDDFQVASFAADGDPAFGIVKTLVVEYTVDGKHLIATGTDPENVVLTRFAGSNRVAELAREPDGQLRLDVWQPGQYAVEFASGETRPLAVTQLPRPLELTGPWDVSFPPQSGLKEPLHFDRLISWTERPESGVKYFSGTATYRAVFRVPAEMLGKGRRSWLDLGDVQVFARVKLNDKQFGVLWKPPYGLDVTDVLTAGQNTLDVSVTNLWPNRMIGDEQLPEDSRRNPDGTLRRWPEWLEQGKPSPAGRQTFTTWRLWKKGDALLKSGLLGPVRLTPSQSVMLPK
jgi:hypothetical protein